MSFTTTFLVIAVYVASPGDWVPGTGYSVPGTRYSGNAWDTLRTAQAPAPKPVETGPQPGAQPGTGTQPNYQIGPQDELRVTVFDAEGLTGVYRVDDDGFISFPLLGRIPVGGTTLGATQEKIRTMLMNGYIRNPQVRVDVQEYKSQSIFVSGEVRAPAELRMTGGMTLLKALAQAGSPMSSASSELTIARQKKPAPGAPAPPVPGGPGSPDATEIIRVNWRDLQTGRASDIALQDGDVIFIPKAQTFFIQGYVRNGGSYVLEPGTTVEQAIALAGGLTERGTNRGIKATRTVNGKPVEVSLSLSDKVQAGDVISIKQRLF
ncbi:MAG TPA: polysaccharide biosynthesis/export family protein [Vicinamibacterales bacterium]|jgi:polysaccharide export outer membrane protein|nr:polysaccharide biosynthesis/export family protein [Vicinamibacterales bacterium]